MFSWGNSAAKGLKLLQLNTLFSMVSLMVLIDRAFIPADKIFTMNDYETFSNGWLELFTFSCNTANKLNNVLLFTLSKEFP